MESSPTNGHPDQSESGVTSWENVHVCQTCGYAIDLSELGLGELTSGLAACKECGSSGQINVHIIEKRPK